MSTTTTTLAAGTIVHVVAFESRDPENGGVGGFNWNTDRQSVVDRFVNDATDVPTFRYVLWSAALPSAMDADKITDWLDGETAGMPNTDQVGAALTW